MIRNYLTIALRNLTRKAGYSFINIGGLTVGLAVAMLIGFWINDELMYDHYHPEYTRVAQVMQHQTFNGEIYTQNAVPRPVETELRRLYGGDFKYIVMSSWTGSHILTYGDKAIAREGNYVTSEGPRLYGLKLIKGSYDGLKDPGSIMLAQSVAKAIFGDKDPINELLKLDNHIDVKVTAVYEDLPMNATESEMKFIAPWEVYVNSERWVKEAENSWGNNSFQCFVQLADHADMNAVSEKIKYVKLDRVPQEDKVFNPLLFLHPMADWHLRSNWKDGIRQGGLQEYIWLFGAVGCFVLLLACINFMNLSTARSEQRAKEVGIRKSIGSLRKQLIQQFLSESLLVVFFAFLLAIIFVSAALPLFNALADKQMRMPLDNGWFWLISLGFILFTGLLSGSYPALYLSSFEPVKVLKGSIRAGRNAGLPRKILVVVQFTVSITLIIGTMIVYRQVQFTKDRPLGYDQNGVVMFQMKTPDFHGKFETLRNELKQAGVIEEVAQSSSPLTGIWSNNGGFTWEGKDPALQTDFASIWVTHEYGKTINWKITEGRDFSRDFATDSTAIIINETAVKFMNLEKPIGKTIRAGQEANAPEYTIVGVVSDVLANSPFEGIKQGIYFNAKTYGEWLIFKLSPSRSTHEAIEGIEKIMKRHVPGIPFDYEFADVSHARKFESEERIGKLSGIFAILAVFISCLGLLGLASFMAAQRTKEIGIRKVLGASTTSLWGMLSKDFIILVIIACVIAVPIAYYYTSSWLSGYAYKTSPSWWIFAIASIGALCITLLTVSFQAIKAAWGNPAKALRSE